jgi:hypothetical protein
MCFFDLVQFLHEHEMFSLVTESRLGRSSQHDHGMRDYGSAFAHAVSVARKFRWFMFQ